MFAAKDKRNGQYLCDFSDNYWHFRNRTCEYLFDTSFYEDLSDKQKQEVHEKMWSASLDGAKLYKTKGGVKNSITLVRKGDLPKWLKIVEVVVVEKAFEM